MSSGGIALSVTGCWAGSLCRARERTAVVARLPVKLLTYQKELTMRSLPTGGVSGTAKMRLLTVSLRENRLAYLVFARCRLCLKCLVSGSVRQTAALEIAAGPREPVACAETVRSGRLDWTLSHTWKESVVGKS